MFSRDGRKTHLVGSADYVCLELMWRPSGPGPTRRIFGSDSSVTSVCVFQRRVSVTSWQERVLHRRVGIRIAVLGRQLWAAVVRALARVSTSVVDIGCRSTAMKIWLVATGGWCPHHRLPLRWLMFGMRSARLVLRSLVLGSLAMLLRRDSVRSTR